MSGHHVFSKVGRVVSKTSPASIKCRLCQKHYALSQQQQKRAFSATIHKSADRDSGLELFGDALRKSSKQQNKPAAPLRPEPSKNIQDLATNANTEAATYAGSRISPDEPYHLNVYAHKHNMHITFTEPSRNPILSFSCGNIGLRKAQRGTFDAAYQLTTYTMRKMAEKQWRQGGKKMTMNRTYTLRDIKGPRDDGNGIEVITRGYGPGREAFQKALLGTDGILIRQLISKVTDGTRLKFGGTRSPNVRRLG